MLHKLDKIKKLSHINLRIVIKWIDDGILFKLFKIKIANGYRWDVFFLCYISRIKFLSKITYVDVNLKKLKIIIREK